MAARMAKGMDPLGDIPSDSDSDDSDSAGGADKVSGPAPAPKKEVDYDALRRAGYAGAPNIMGIKEKHGEGSWGWSQGRRGEIKHDDMTRDELRHATNEAGFERHHEGLQAACGAAIEAAEEAKRRRAKDRADREEAIANRRRIEQETRDALRAEKQKKTFNAKEKRKREHGQQSNEKNWVEEEKRLLRHSGAGGFGFD